MNILGLHVVQNGTAPEKKEIDMKNGLKKAEKDVKKWSEQVSETIKPLSCRLKISHWHFSNFIAQNLHQQKNVSPRGSAGVASSGLS